MEVNAFMLTNVIGIHKEVTRWIYKTYKIN